MVLGLKRFSDHVEFLPAIMITEECLWDSTEYYIVVKPEATSHDLMYNCVVSYTFWLKFKIADHFRIIQGNAHWNCLSSLR